MANRVEFKIVIDENGQLGLSHPTDMMMALGMLSAAQGILYEKFFGEKVQSTGPSKIIPIGNLPIPKN